jgi:hypothetical protein
MCVAVPSIHTPSPGDLGSDRSSFCEICLAVLDAWDNFSMELEHSHVLTLFEANELLELRNKQGCHLCSIFAGYDKYVEEFKDLRSRENDLLLQGEKLLGTTTYQMLQNSDAIELYLRHTLNGGRDTRRITHSLPVIPWSGKSVIFPSSPFFKLRNISRY